MPVITEIFERNKNKFLPMKIEVISATRLSEELFWNKSPLGISLQRLRHDTRVIPRITFNNQKGLPIIYNDAILSAKNRSFLVFIHDDVWIDDYFLSTRIREGLSKFDIIGVAGNRRITTKQPAWIFNDHTFTWDDKANLTGAVAHAKHPFGRITFFGEVPAECALLDGVLLAAQKAVLVNAQCFFDSRFDFHFYDMDFCRTAKQNQLTLGTWPISITHQSGGAFGSEQWKKSYNAYIDKWGE
jgi:hypothetical protein